VVKLAVSVRKTDARMALKRKTSMNFYNFLKKRFLFSLNKAVVLIVALSTISSTAFASSSWSQAPSWASSGSENTSSRKSNYSKDRYGVSPFAPGSNNIALDVGQVFLMGDLSSKFNDSIGTQLHYTYGVSDMFGFDASAGYSSHSDGKIDGQYSLASLLTGVRMNLSWYDKVVPHAVFGLGFYRPSHQILPADSKSGPSTIAPIVFGLHVGPGVDLELTKQLFFGAALTFHDIFGTTKFTDDGKMLDVGGTYTSFFLRLGVTF